ncbi:MULTISPECIES: hypothetical protein [Pseudomonas]|jgi:hypothetical protein|uniref:Uncharacterized protein n=1 Tax=Pseudomonas juntendi TaxID=2666183 RepID=A0ABD4YGI6_9PSED|nr:MULTISPECIES: hypothetical protein [Pseudomonas]MBH3374558.1 hypothetical protein [Pseudomonas juntendi]MBS6040188.1 hypothetical protein [Pseudomonas sp.]MDH0758621.1 hypothetical protein [Pseudomonas juntendi]MDH1921154.1 hypothetical protein [Pseudomonas juntendi]CAH0645912.1 hypothetical protein PSNVIR_00211 [Pseudomonas sp. Nvir]
MKEWEVTFANQKGELSSLLLQAEDCPSEEEAARAIRSHLFPVMAELDLNDFQDRASSPTARWLREHSGVQINSIHEHP